MNGLLCWPRAGADSGLPPLAKLLAFQLLGFALVASPALHLDVFAVALLCLWLPLHLYFSPRAGADRRMLLAALLLGPSCDLVLLHSGLIEYHGISLGSGLPPLWIYAMWANFALLFQHSLRILGRHLWLSIPLALVSAPLAYFGGSALGAATLAQPIWLPLSVVALCWLVIVPTLAVLSGSRQR